jgi:hypothetical protein
MSDPVYTTYNKCYKHAITNANGLSAATAGSAIYQTTLTALAEKFKLPGVEAECETLTIFYSIGIDSALRHWSDVLKHHNVGVA